MKWADFAPYVLPHVMGCPIPVLEHHVRQAAITFCRKTLCHRINVDSVTLTGRLVAPIPNHGLRLVKIKGISVDGNNVPLIDPSRGMLMERQDAPGEYAYTKDNVILHVQPEPDNDAAIVVDAAVCPSDDAKRLDPNVAAHYAADIARGAIASIAMLPKQEFSDMGVAMAHAALFKSAIDTTAMKVARGLMNQKMTSFAGHV